MTPAPVTACRVLEIGCGDGGNLIPLAYHLPESHFTGIDLAAAPIAAGACDGRRIWDSPTSSCAWRILRDLGPDEGEFDYIFAHGLYSWIPADVRDRLLAVCRERLAPQGVAFVSYNVYPGPLPAPDDPRDPAVSHASDRRPRGAHRRSAPPARAARITKRPSRHGAKRRQPVPRRSGADQRSRLVPRIRGARRRHGLQYLGEADSHKTFDPAHAERPQRRRDRTGAIRGFPASSGASARRCCAARRSRSTAHRSRPDGRIPVFRESARATDLRRRGVQAVEAVVQALHDTGRLPVHFEELIPYAGNAELLREILFALLTVRLRQPACPRFSLRGDGDREAARQPSGALPGVAAEAA